MKTRKIKAGYETSIWLGKYPNRKQVKVSAKTVSDLKDRVQLVKDEYKLKEGLVESDKTFIEYAREWLPIHAQTEQLAIKTIEGYENHIESKIANSNLANKKLFEIKGKDIKLFHRDLLTDYSTQTVRSIHSTCRAILSTAVAEERVMVNPFINNKAPKLNKVNKNTLEIDRSRIIDKDTFQKMMNHMTSKIKLSDNSPFYNFIAQSTFSGLLVAYMFGLRPQEIVGLKWTDLRTDKNGTHTLTVERAVTIAKDTSDSKKTTMPIFKGTKTGATRNLTVGKTVMNLLEDYRSYCDEYWSDDRWDNTHNLMFPTPTGEIMSMKVLSQRFKDVMRNITDEQTAKFHKLYDLRHTHASQLINEGWDLVAVSKRLGHSDTTTTLKYYAHLVPNRDSSHVESFENSILGSNN